MTPMIDVVFLLLIFFICTASFQRPESILPSNLQLAGTSTEPLPIELEYVDLEWIVVRITLAASWAGTSPSQHDPSLTRYELNDQPCPSLAQLGELLRTLAGIDAGLPVVLDSAGEVPLGSLIDVYDACRLAGFTQIQFATAHKE